MTKDAGNKCGWPSLKPGIDRVPAVARLMWAERGRWMAALDALIRHPRFERLILVLIAINAATLGLETSKSIMASYGLLLIAIDRLLLAIFVVELTARMIVFGSAFWRDPWNLFDFVVVAIALVPASGDLAILRALRILRVLRVITVAPSIRRVVASLLSAIPSMGAIIILLLLLNYVFAVMATKLFGAEFEANFGTLGASFFTFFQIMTLEGWSGEIVRPVMAKYPWAWVLFVPYIVLATFMVLNLFIGIIVDAIQNQALAEQDVGMEKHGEQAVVIELRKLRAEMADTKALVMSLQRGRQE